MLKYRLLKDRKSNENLVCWLIVIVPVLTVGTFFIPSIPAVVQWMDVVFLVIFFGYLIQESYE